MYLGLWLATALFQNYLIRKNWRYTQYFTTFFQVVMGLLWIPAYYNSGGLRNAWYTIFIDLDSVRIARLFVRLNILVHLLLVVLY